MLRTEGQLQDWPDDSAADLQRFYSQPTGTASWEIKNLVYVPCPWRVYTSWDPPKEYSKGIRIHKLCAASLSSVMDAIWEALGRSQEAIAGIGMSRLGGSYFYRPRRGSRRLSLHAYGAAIDWDPVHNQMHHGNHGRMDERVIKAFHDEGWRWGGLYGDPMHFEACR